MIPSLRADIPHRTGAGVEVRSVSELRAFIQSALPDADYSIKVELLNKRHGSGESLMVELYVWLPHGTIRLRGPSVARVAAELLEELGAPREIAPGTLDVGELPGPGREGVRS
jgi:hypothetical protein